MTNILVYDDRNYLSQFNEFFADIPDCKATTFQSIKELLKSIPVTKPQIILVDSKTANSKYTKSIIEKYPFTPIVVYGDFGKNPKKINKYIRKLIERGFSLCLPTQTLLNKDSFLSELNKVIWQGLAKPELWDKEYNITVSEQKTTLFRNIITVCITVGIIVISGLIFQDKILVSENVSPKIYAVPYSNLSGFVFSRNILWTCDWQTQNIYKHSLDSKLSIKRVFSMPEMRFTSITIAKGYLWSIEPWQKKIFKHNFDANLSIIAKYNIPGTNPTGITFDGKYILTCDNATDKIYRHKIDKNLTVLQEFSSPGPNPISIYSDGKALWVADSETNKIYRCLIEDYELIVDAIFIPPEYEHFKVSGISGNKNFLWLASETDNKIYKYPKKFLEPFE